MKIFSQLLSASLLCLAFLESINASTFLDKEWCGHNLENESLPLFHFIKHLITKTPLETQLSKVHDQAAITPFTSTDGTKLLGIISSHVHARKSSKMDKYLLEGIIGSTPSEERYEEDRDNEENQSSLSPMYLGRSISESTRRNQLLLNNLPGFFFHAILIFERVI